MRRLSLLTLFFLLLLRLSYGQVDSVRSDSTGNGGGGMNINVRTALVLPLSDSSSNGSGDTALKGTRIPITSGSGYILKAGQSANISSTVSVTLSPGVSFQSGSQVSVTIANPLTLAAVPAAPSNDYNLNWVLARSYDENGNEMSASKGFFDNNGKSLQTQTRNETAAQVLATQMVYDEQKRAAITSLPAPTYNSAFAYSPNFILNSSGAAYDYTNFDVNPSTGTSKVYSPDPVGGTTTPGSLGWYYSNSNTMEPLVGNTSYPYSRVSYFGDGTGATKSAAGAGDYMEMGQGHETMSASFPVINELAAYLTVRNKYFTTGILGALPTSMAGSALQSIATDQNGMQVLTVTDLSGKKVLMTARALPTAPTPSTDPYSYQAVTNTLSLSNVQGMYTFNVNTDNGLSNSGPSGSSQPNNITNFTIGSSDPVTVSCITCSVPNVYSGSGDLFTFPYGGTGVGYNYTITSATPFTVTATANGTTATAVYDQAEAQYIEPTGTSIGYFELTSSSTVNISGNYQLYEMKGETQVAGVTNNSTVLQPGYYKIIALPSTVSGSVNQVSLTYTNYYTDISYNYYNQLGQLAASIPPNGVYALNKNISGITSLATIPYVSTYSYDLQGRLISSTSPDGGTATYIYRKDGKIRFSQNAYQKTAASVNPSVGTNYTYKFSYTNYDTWGRPIEVGEYAVTTTPSVFSALSTNTTVLEATDVTGGLATIDPKGVKLSTIDTYYDLPDPNLAAVVATITANAYAQDAGFLKGAVSYTKNANSTTWYNYDDHGRVTWLVKSIAGLGVKTIDYTYNAQGNVVTVAYQKNTPADEFNHYYSYDADGRLTGVQTSRDGVTKVQQANYYYYLHGPLKRVELGNSLQGLDYVYTTQGWLKSVNSATGVAASDPGQDGVSTSSFAPDAFGMQLDYFPNDYVRKGNSISSLSSIYSSSTPYYNGNVSAMSWNSQKSVGSTNSGPTTYLYTYDPKYQLTSATWGSPNFSSGSVTGSTLFGESVTGYDPNGNITGLQRTDGSGKSDPRFSTYSYAANTNELASVGNSTAPNAYASYTYDQLGQLKSEAASAYTPPSGTASPAVSFYPKFDVTGKMTGIYSNPTLATQMIGYTYDESGNRISRTDYYTNPKVPSTTYFVYDGAGNIMAIYTGTTMTEVPVYGLSRLGTYTPSNNSYVYELRDNVGSVRVVLSGTKGTGNQAVVTNWDDYYPFGSIAQSGTTGSTYRYDYQGLYAQKDNITNWNDFELRMYDAKIGRWLSMDPQGQFASPYEGMGNNPANGSDPTGGDVDSGDGCCDLTAIWSWVKSMVGIQTIQLPEVDIHATRTPPPEATVSAYTPNFWDNWSTSTNIFAKLSYNVADDAYLTAKTLFVPASDWKERHLNGDWATPNQRIGAFGNTFAAVLTGGSGGEAATLGGSAEVQATSGAGRVFWSGGPVAMNEAAEFASSTGGTTLEMTRGGKIMTALNPILPRSISTPIWNNLSKSFAEGATGMVDVFQNTNGVRLGSIWATTEYGILTENNINITYHMVTP